MVKKQHKHNSKAKAKINLRGWYLLIIAAALLFISTLPLFENVYFQITVQIVGYVTIVVAVAIEIADIVKKKDARLQIDLFMTAFAVVLTVMAGYFIFSERAALETQALRDTVQNAIPGIRESLPDNSIETGGTLSDVWVSKTENYVFVEYLTNRSLPETVKVDNTELKQHVVDLVCSDSQYDSILNNGWGFTFLYTSTLDGKTTQVNVTPSDCN